MSQFHEAHGNNLKRMAQKLHCFTPLRVCRLFYSDWASDQRVVQRECRGCYCPDGLPASALTTGVRATSPDEQGKTDGLA